MDANYRRGIGLSAVGAFWAAAYLIPYKLGATSASAEVMVLPMLLSAAVLNTLGLAFERPFRFRLDRTSILVSATLGLLAAVGNEAMARALVLIGPGLAAVTLRTQVIFVALGAWWLMGERVSPRFWLGLLLAMGGVVLLQRQIEGGPDPLPGLLWVLVAALAFGSMQVVVRRSIHRIRPLVVNMLRLWISAALLALVPGRVGLLGATDAWIWTMAALAALCGPVLSRIFLMWALRHMPAAHSTLILFLAPVFAFVMGGFVFGTWPDWIQLAGSAVVLVGVGLPVWDWVRADRKLSAPGAEPPRP